MRNSAGSSAQSQPTDPASTRGRAVGHTGIPPESAHTCRSHLYGATDTVVVEPPLPQRVRTVLQGGQPPHLSALRRVLPRGVRRHDRGIGRPALARCRRRLVGVALARAGGGRMVGRASRPRGVFGTSQRDPLTRVCSCGGRRPRPLHDLTGRHALLGSRGRLRGDLHHPGDPWAPTLRKIRGTGTSGGQLPAPANPASANISPNELGTSIWIGSSILNGGRLGSMMFPTSTGMSL